MTSYIENIFSFIQSNPMFLVMYSLYNVTLKGFSLWKAARNSHKYWFIGLLAINLFGIPEILYLLFFSKNRSAVENKLHKETKTAKLKKEK